MDVELIQQDNVELEHQLIEVGNKLSNPPPLTDDLLLLLDHSCQSSPFKFDCVPPVRFLADQSNRSYNKRLSVLENVCKTKAFVIMLDIECDVVIVRMFEHFLRSIRDYHRGDIFLYMETIMVLILKESEEVSVELLKPLLASVKKHSEGVLPVARELGEGVLWKSAEKLKPYLMQAVSALGDPLDTYTEIVTSVCGGTTATFQRDDENHSQLSALKVGWTVMKPSLVGSCCCNILLAHSKSRVGPWGLSEGSGFLVPRVEGNALGWFHRAANTSRSRQWKDNELVHPWLK
ncbi:sister chromatid cohesion protein PDS5-like protein isoform X1 [Tanacetum coccineum]|uniref:Sister chromatid cohesion protein PDS5-like protein isoform X1 n=1 Tax=Tanacetum coccineum TaxID=301880 RepID=A0ABQ5GPD8_9ASTR